MNSTPFRSIASLINVRLFSSSYSSSISLSNLYPKSSLSITAPVKLPESKFNGFIPIEKLDINYSRSSGPGGQNVNKLSTKVDIRFHIESADWLDNEVKLKVLEKFKNRVNKDGYLIVRSEKTRSQLYNQADAMTQLRSILRSAAAPEPPGPTEETLHMLRKRKEKANRERLFSKRSHSLTKQDRRDPDY